MRLFERRNCLLIGVPCLSTILNDWRAFYNPSWVLLLFFVMKNQTNFSQLSTTCLFTETKQNWNMFRALLTSILSKQFVCGILCFLTSIFATFCTNLISIVHVFKILQHLLIRCIMLLYFQKPCQTITLILSFAWEIQHFCFSYFSQCSNHPLCFIVSVKCIWKFSTVKCLFLLVGTIYDAYCDAFRFFQQLDNSFSNFWPLLCWTNQSLLI